jgi:hypothetical protein
VQRDRIVPQGGDRQASTDGRASVRRPADDPSQNSGVRDEGVAAHGATLTVASAEAAPTRVVPPSDGVNLPPGFGISVFVERLRAPRMMAVGRDGHFYLAERGAGRIVRQPSRKT